MDGDEVVCGYLIVRHVAKKNGMFQIGCYYHESLFGTELLGNYFVHKLTEQILENKWDTQSLE